MDGCGDPVRKGSHKDAHFEVVDSHAPEETVQLLTKDSRTFVTEGIGGKDLIHTLLWGWFVHAAEVSPEVVKRLPGDR